MIGPDAARYLLAGQGEQVARPFCWRWLAPMVCKANMRRWSALWVTSWAVMAAAAVWWAHGEGLGIHRAVAVAVMLAALPGVWGPHGTHPVGVDVPALAAGMVAAAAFGAGWWPLAIAAVLVAAAIKETTPVWVALWVWSPVPLIGLLAVAIAVAWRRPTLDRVTAQPVLRRVHEHPIRSSLEHHRGRWRDAWLMVAPWGVTLAALLDPTPALLVLLVLAYAQLLVATDSVRLYQSAAGPLMALGAVTVIPDRWLLIAVVVHVVWWRKPEVV